MASSKVEIASSASPFGCVLRDHNWRDRLSRNNRENCSNVETSFQTNIKYFVHDHHFSATICDSSPPKDAGEWLVNTEKNTISKDTSQNDGRRREISPNLSDDSSIETNNTGCVSSLVQRWREFSDTKHVTKKTNNPILSNADASIILEKSNHCQEIMPSVSAETTSDSISDKFDTPCSGNLDTQSMNIKDDAFLDFESESRSLEDSGEKEKIRVADVIRKLILENGNGTEIKLNEQEKRCFSPVTPRFRGRHAFNDLLMQLERDRHMELDTLGERRAVSKFSHRGRIQSLLRLRFLRKDAIVRHYNQKQKHSKLIGPQNLSHSTPASSLQQPLSCEESTIVDNPQISPSNPIIIKTQKTEEIVEQEQSVSKSVAEQNSPAIDSPSSQNNQMSQGSKVVFLREKFNLLDKNDPGTPKTPRGVAKKYNPCIKSFSTSDQPREELHEQHEVGISARTSCSSQNSVFKETEESSISSCSDPLRKEIVIDSIFSLETVRISTVSNEDVEHRDQGDCSNLQEEENHEVDHFCWPAMEIISTKSNGDLDKRDKDESNFLRQDDKNEVHSMTISNGWEGSNNLVEDDQSNQDMSDRQILENGEEWINNDVQYWSQWDEDVSNLNWVSDIARPRSDWENLRQERYRDMLDSDQENDEMRRLLERRSVSSFLTSNLRDTMDQLMISRAERVPQSTINNHENRVEQVKISQIQTQTNIRKEDKEEEEEGQDSNFSDQVRYPSLEQPRSSQSSCPDTQLLSGLTNRSSIDIEYMYDLRAYMEQLQQEVSELRKTVNTCMSMHEKMQCSIKQEVAAAVDLSVGREVQGLPNNNTRTRNCCLCYEMQVDSLLYRCGHMCTCFKCAHELQWSTGKCPICRAPIVDVVRAYPGGKFFGRR